MKAGYGKPLQSNIGGFKVPGQYSAIMYSNLARPSLCVADTSDNTVSASTSRRKRTKTVWLHCLLVHLLQEAVANSEARAALARQMAGVQ